MYYEGSVVGKASTVLIEMSPTPPLIFTGAKKCEFDVVFKDNSNPRVGADHGVDFDWSRQSRDCPDVSGKILNSVQHCRSSP